MPVGGAGRWSSAVNGNIDNNQRVCESSRGQVNTTAVTAWSKGYLNIRFKRRLPALANPGGQTCANLLSQDEPPGPSRSPS